MSLVNKLTRPGGIRRLELRPERVRVILSDGTEKVYRVVTTESRDIVDNMRRFDNGTDAASHVLQG